MLVSGTIFSMEIPPWDANHGQRLPKSTSKSVLDLSFKRNIDFLPIALGLWPEHDLAGAGTS